MVFIRNVCKMEFEHINKHFIADELQKHLAKMHHEKDLQSDFDALTSKGQEFVQVFSALIDNEGRSVIQTEDILLSVQDIKKADVQSYNEILNGFKEGLLEVKGKLFVLQGMVNNTVEASRGKILMYRQDILQKQDKIENIDKRIEITEKTIAEYETAASTYDNSARELEKSSSEHVGKTFGHALGILGGVVGYGVGVALGPITGGASVAVGVLVAGGSIGGNAVGVGYNVAKALDHKEKANDARKHAHTARRERSKLIDEKSSFSSEIRSLQINVGEIQSQIENLEGLENFLYRCVDSIDRFVINVQNVDAVNVSVLNQAGTLSIAQRASMRHESKYVFGQKILDDFKSKWSVLATNIKEISTQGRYVVGSQRSMLQGDVVMRKQLKQSMHC